MKEVSQAARATAERYHRFAINYPELAARALPEFIQTAMDHALERAQLHPDWRHKHPAAYAVFVPDHVRIEDFDDYAVFCDRLDAQSFTERLEEAVLNQLDREPTEKEMTIYPLHAVKMSPRP